MAATSPLRRALAELDQEGSLAEEQLARLVERSVLDTYRRVVGDDPDVRVHVDVDKGAFELYRQSGEAREPLSLEGDFPRQAAMATKAAVAGWLRDAERDRVVREASAHRHEMIDAIVERSDSAGCWLRGDRYAAILPPEEQMPGDTLEPHRHLKVVVVDARRRGRDAVVVVSRSHPMLLRRLLEQEVPELAEGRVTVRGVAREAGRRSKVAVHAPAGDLDAQGACIGPRGVRIRAVVGERGEEQVQVVEWSSDPAAYVAAALAPADVGEVELDAATRTAHVVVPDSQLSLAIGRAGENARLAARLTGWRIDIAGDGSSGVSEATGQAGR